MPVTDICIYFIIAILGLAYPISFQTITRLDEKYNSINITSLFEKSAEWIWFGRLLPLSLICVLIEIVWTINFRSPANPNSPFYDWIDIVLIIITVLMIAAFLFYTRKAFVYYVPHRLAEYLRQQRETEEHLYFIAMADLLYTGIRVRDVALIETVYRYVNQQFGRYRNETGNGPVQYPAVFYDMAYKTIQQAGSSAAKEIQFIGFSAASGRWLLGGTEYHPIDEQTYQWLWANMRLIVELQQDDYLFEFWKNSHQYSYTGLERIAERRDPDNPLTILNNEEVNQRELERDRFYEFHFALGGMLLYAERQTLLRRIFNHTMSIPARYELLPTTMAEIFNLFFRFWNPAAGFYIGNYGFPGLDGIDGEQQSRAWICRYIALLMIRQYHIRSQWYGYEPVEIPHVPRTQAERYTWIHQLRFLKMYVLEIQTNQALLKTLGYERIDEEWGRKNNKPIPEELIAQAIVNAEAAYANGEAEQETDPRKIRFFLTRSAQIVGLRIDAYQNILNEESIVENYNLGFITGNSVLFEKAAFALDQPISHLNYDTFLASELATKVTHNLTGMFQSKVNISYLFKAAQLFKAIDKMRLNGEEHVLLNFGIDVDVVNHKLKLPNLSSENYGGIPIIKVAYSDQQLIRSSLLVMRKTSLPEFEFGDVEAEDIERFSLEHINQVIHLYGSVIDLNENQEVRSLFPNEREETLDKSVFLKLDLMLKVRWRNAIKIVQLGLYSEFYQQGDVNDLTEVETF
ncbi:MAG: hypothetical protein JWP94_3646 [Mucilaginibacter sp.]|nr:hypothetical protein [Mucilaginibacter sp.]